jgi:hypothetical protein
VAVNVDGSPDVCVVEVGEREVGLRARCLVLRVLRVVAIRPVLPSQIGCQTLERGLLRVSVVAAVHHTRVWTWGYLFLGEVWKG